MVAMHIRSQAGVAALLLLAHSMPVYSLQLDNTDDIVKTSKNLASDLIAFYKGDIPGLLPENDSSDNDKTGYYWYQSGAFWSTFIDYWQLTGDDTYNDRVTKGIQWQVGQNDDFMPANQTRSLGNDDQAVWALGALTAAEYGFPDPPAKDPQWLDLAIAVWEEQRQRWDAELEEKTCDGGLRWQIASFNAGYTYKSTLSNTLFFAIGARLARMTGNETYASYAEKAWDWLYDIELIDHDTWAVYDGAYVDSNCSEISKVQWSSAATSLTMGAAFMYNYTEGSEEWQTRVSSLTESALELYFDKKTGNFKEVSCSVQDKCPHDLPTFKALSHRWLAVTSQAAPFTADSILPVLRKSAEVSKEDNKGADAMEQTMGSLAAVSNLLIADSSVPGTKNQSENNKSNGTDDDSNSDSSTSEGESKDGENSAGRLALSAFAPICLLVSAFVWMV